MKPRKEGIESFLARYEMETEITAAVDFGPSSKPVFRFFEELLDEKYKADQAEI
jgi:hypothetical protein